MAYFMDPNDFWAQTDSGRIQQAVDAAAKTGCNKVVIPALNKRTGAYLWEIDTSIELPSHMYVEINNAHLRMADGVFCQMFRNSLAFAEIGKTPEGLQEDIIIQGIGRALLDGGKHNGLLQVNSGQNGMPNIVHNSTIYFHNVKNFKVDGLTIRDQRWWAITLTFAWEGILSNMRFEITQATYRQSSPKYAAQPWCNQDGIDLRIGCHDIHIFNLSGQCGDDIVALTALAPRTSGAFENVYRCEHLSPDIYNVSIRNISGFTDYCAIIRLLCHHRNRLYNIHIDNIIDTSAAEQSFVINESLRNTTCVKIGEYGYYGDNPGNLCQLGEMRNISVSNVYSSAMTAVAMNVAVQNITLRNIFVGEQGCHGVSVTRAAAGRHYSLEDPLNLTVAENILVDGIQSAGKREGASPLFFTGMTARNFVVKNVSYPKDQPLFREMNPQEGSEPVVFENTRSY